MNDKTPDELLARAKERGAIFGGHANGIPSYLVFTPDEFQAFTHLTAQPVQTNPAPGYCKNCKDYTIEEPLFAQPAQPAQQLSQDARLLKALQAAQRVIDSMKQTAETAGAGGDKRMLQEACESISKEGLSAFTAINAAIAARGATTKE